MKTLTSKVYDALVLLAVTLICLSICLQVFLFYGDDIVVASAIAGVLVTCVFWVYVEALWEEPIV